MLNYTPNDRKQNGIYFYLWLDLSVHCNETELRKQYTMIAIDGQKLIENYQIIPNLSID
jgi:hypothetical protein